jgi:hypothetical protein
MGRIGFIDSVERSATDGFETTDVKIDVGGGEVVTPPQAAPPGIDAHPLLTDKAVTTGTPGDSGEVVVGYLDGKNLGVSAEGEFKANGRAADGTILVSVWVKNDGTAIIENDGAKLELKLDGSVELSNSKGAYSLDVLGNLAITLGQSFIRMDQLKNVSISNGIGVIAITPAGAVSINGKLTIAP